MCVYRSFLRHGCPVRRQELDTSKMDRQREREGSRWMSFFSPKINKPSLLHRDCLLSDEGKRLAKEGVRKKKEKGEQTRAEARCVSEVSRVCEKGKGFFSINEAERSVSLSSTRVSLTSPSLSCSPSTQASIKVGKLGERSKIEQPQGREQSGRASFFHCREESGVHEERNI